MSGAPSSWGEIHHVQNGNANETFLERNGPLLPCNNAVLPRICFEFPSSKATALSSKNDAVPEVSSSRLAFFQDLYQFSEGVSHSITNGDQLSISNW